MPSLGMVGRITTLRLQHSPTSGQASFCINNSSELRSLQPFRATGAPSPSVRTAFFAELRSAVEKGFSKLGLMLFMQLDHGAILRKETGHESPKMIRWIVAKPEVFHTGSGH